MYLNIETIRDILTHMGYSNISSQADDYDILYKNSNSVLKCIALIKPYMHQHRSIADTRAEINRILVSSRLGSVKKDNLLIVLQNINGMAHHYIGKNIIYLNGSGNHVFAYSISKSMRDEFYGIKYYKRIEKCKDKQYKYRFPENNRHSSLPLYLLVIITVLISLKCLLLGDGSLGYSADKVLDGNWTSMITYMFVHGNLRHLISNMIALLCVGKTVMEIEGIFNFSIIYFFSGFIAALGDCYYQVNNNYDTSMLTIGASGAIFALMGALIVEAFSDYYVEQNRRKVLFSVLLTFILSNIGHNINIRTHVIGLISGIIICIVVRIVSREINYIKLLKVRKKQSCYMTNREDLFYDKKRTFMGPITSNGNAYEYRL